MKKRLIWFIVLVSIMGIGCVILFTPLYSVLRDVEGIGNFIASLRTGLGKLYRSVLGFDVVKENRFGFLTLLVSLIVAIFAFAFLKVKKVDDTTMPVLDVEHKIIAVDYNKDALAPNMVIVHEKKFDGGNK